MNAHKVFGLHDVQLMVGHEWYKMNKNFLEALARGGFSPAIQEINAFADRYNSYSYQRNYNVEGYFATSFITSIRNILHRHLIVVMLPVVLLRRTVGVTSGVLVVHGLLVKRSSSRI